MNKNGRKGALKRTNTPNNPEVYPAKKPRINEKTIAIIKNSFDLICLIAKINPVRNISEMVRSKNTKVSTALIKINKLPPSQINGLKNAVKIEIGIAFNIPIGE